MSHFCCLCPAGASHRPAQTQGGEIDCTTTWRGCGYHVESPATCECRGNFPGDSKTSHCHSTGNPEDKGSRLGWGEGQCPAEDGSDSVRAQMRPGVVGENMREERQEPGRRQLCHREPRMVSARSISRSHWLHCYWGRLFAGGSSKAMAPHSSTLAWRIPWMEEPGGLQSSTLAWKIPWMEEPGVAKSRT